MRKIYFIFKRLGFPKVFICLFQKIYYLALSKIFKFDVWHASAPFSCRPYKSEVVDLVNSLKSTSVIEVGCGLGDIISRINCSKCYGVDKDSNVINAARKINGNVRYFVSDIGSVQRVIDCNETIELLIMVNWPHGVEWKNLSSSVLSIVSAYDISSIIIDGIKPEMHDYANHYDESVFSEWGDVQLIQALSDNVRYLYYIKVKHTF